MTIRPTRIEFSAYDIYDYFPLGTNTEGVRLIMEDFAFGDDQGTDIVHSAVKTAVDNGDLDIDGYTPTSFIIKSGDLHGGPSEDEPIIILDNIEWGYTES